VNTVFSPLNPNPFNNSLNLHDNFDMGEEIDKECWFYLNRCQLKIHNFHFQEKYNKNKRIPVLDIYVFYSYISLKCDKFLQIIILL
jgi:hypothetical protein